MKKLTTTLFFLIFATGIVTAAIPTLPVSEIKPGMKGVCKTVFSGTEIEEFDVEVVDILNNYAPKLNAIIVKLLGEKVEKTGVVSGMSGSPVYINGKLIGALAFSFGIFMKEPLAGITPIEYMLEVEDYEQKRELELTSVQYSSPVKLDELILQENTRVTDLFSKFAANLKYKQRNFDPLKPISIPLTFSGFHPSVIAKIRPMLENLGFTVIQGGTAGSLSQNDIQLEPGAAVSGVIISGDMSVSGTGTVTFRDGDKILAFGHPFFNYGPIKMPMANAKILTVLSSYMHSRKLAITGDIIGSIHQDRFPGILGIVGEEAPMFPVTIKYTSTLGENKSYHYKVAKDRSLQNLVPPIFFMTLLSSIETARFANGDYSIHLTGSIEMKDLPDVTFDNFYSASSFTSNPGGGTDIMASAFDITMALMPLMNNHFDYPDIEGIELNFKAIPGSKRLLIDNVWFDKTEVEPGDKLNLQIELKEYQGKSVFIDKIIRIPENISVPLLIITVGSSDYIDRWEKSTARGKYTPDNITGLITILNNQKKNNKLYIQVNSPERGSFVNGKELSNLPPTIMNILNEKKTSGKIKLLNKTTLEEFEHPMDYRIFGGKAIRLRVRDNKRF
ncbi:hypothetical protein GF337_04955 [candidate division KSB1 bacterium]|nr:hypothetical protein [candidate division KSB1 bacterium]